MDLFLFHSINGFAGKRRWLDCLGVFFARHLGYVLVLMLFLVSYFDKRPQLFLFAVLAGIISRFLINEIIYFFYKRKRPPEVVNAKTLIKTPKHPAFPSGHASFFFSISFAVLPYNFSLGIIFIFLSSLISFARIFAGVHWPSDILAGAGAGILSNLLIWIFFNL
ncbi:MAG: phosphatase PAP2 family protein [Candidatus Staskawiczbacteria bacterium]|nr:phosphatase PAP2 family protein [Candidatus Staskawiczbacteria bacterium]